MTLQFENWVAYISGHTWKQWVVRWEKKRWKKSEDDLEVELQI